MKKLLLSLLVAFGAASGLNAMDNPYSMKDGAYGSEYAHYLREMTKEKPRVEREQRELNKITGLPVSSTMRRMANPNPQQSYAQKMKQYYKELAAYRKEVAERKRWESRNNEITHNGTTIHSKAPHAVDEDVSNKVCNIMMSSPKVFKSIKGMNNCSDCHCIDGVMTCKCRYEIYSGMDTSKTVKASINFSDPHNHPVIVVTEDGNMELMPLEHFEKDKAYQEKYIDPKQDLDEKIYMK